MPDTPGGQMIPEFVLPRNRSCNEVRSPSLPPPPASSPSPSTTPLPATPPPPPPSQIPPPLPSTVQPLQRQYRRRDGGHDENSHRSFVPVPKLSIHLNFVPDVFLSALHRERVCPIQKSVMVFGRKPRVLMLHIVEHSIFSSVR